MQRTPSILRNLVVPALFIWVACFGVWQAATLTDTTDEMIHVSSAYLAQTRGEYRFDPEHPALFKHLSALPLHFLELNNPPEDESLWNGATVTTFDSWKEARTWSEQWVYSSNNPSWLMIFLSRIPGVLALLSLCFVVWRFTAVHISDRLAPWALFFTATTPTLLAHGSLTNTDVPVALTAMLVVWSLYVYSLKPSRQQALLVGLTLGVALATKFSAIILLPVALGWLIWCARAKQLRQQFWTDLILALVVLVVVIWAAYGFHSAPVVLGDGPESLPLQIIRSKLEPYGLHFASVMEVARLILPLDWLKGAVLALGAGVTGRGSYLLGTTYSTGVILYFPILLLLKTQLSSITLLLWGVLTSARQGWLHPKHWKPVLWLLGTVGGLALAAGMASKLSIGIRHISILMPILAIALGAITLHLLERTPKQWRTGVAVSIVLCTLLPVLLQARSMISFGNILTIPTQNRWQLMADSNLDWGQQLYQVKDAMLALQQPGETLYLNWRWNGDMVNAIFPESTRFEPLTLPEAGLFAVTATQLTEDEYRYFRSVTPVAVLSGGNTLIYRAPIQ